MSFQLGVIPKTKPFQFADLAELLILVGEYSELSVADLSRIIAEGQADPDSLGEEETDASRRPDPSAPVGTRDHQYASECFEHLRSRKKAFGRFYPFHFDGRTLKLKPNLTEPHRFYIFTLCCARLSSFPTAGGLRQAAAKTFTELSAQVMADMLPSGSVVRIFDANSSDRANHYGNNLRKALKQLAVDLCEPPNLDAIEEQETSGDAGLDLVGIFDLKDASRGHIALFGQCASQQDGWTHKTLEASPERLRSLIQFSHAPGNVLFMPVFYRKTTGTWVNQLHTGSCILMDRLRIVKLLSRRSFRVPAALNRSIGQRLQSFLPTTFA